MSDDSPLDGERRRLHQIKDHEGRVIRLTRERVAHIRDHPEMVAMDEAIVETLATPDQVIQSRSAADVWLYYRRYPETSVGDKLLCVVVKIRPEDAFVVTAYLTDEAKRGRVIWRRLF